MREHHLLPSEGVRSRSRSAPSSRARVPRDVQTAFLLWLVAVGAGVAETVVRVVHSLSVGSGGDSMSGVVIRVAVYSVVVYVVTRMRLGKRWARLALAVILGGLGTLSLVVDPISWLATGNPPRAIFAEGDLLFALVAPIRIVHLAAVFGALVFMFRPDSNAYFRASAR